MTPLEQNARDLELELEWLARLIDTRFKHYFASTAPGAGRPADLAAVPPPDLTGSTSPYAAFLRHYELPLPDRVAVALALSPHVRPQALDLFTTKNPTFDRRFVELGGARSGPDGDFLPTGETLAFLLGGGDLATRFAVQRRYGPGHLLARHDALRLSPLGDEPPMKAPLTRMMP